MMTKKEKNAYHQMVSKLPLTEDKKKCIIRSDPNASSHQFSCPSLNDFILQQKKTRGQKASGDFKMSLHLLKLGNFEFLETNSCVLRWSIKAKIVEC